MDYMIVAIQNGEVFDIEVKISNDTEEIMTGKTSVCCSTEDEAKAYAETVFLPDLKANFKILADLEAPDDTTTNIEG
jgi:hypothetical protein